MKLLVRGSKTILCRFISTAKFTSRGSCEIFDAMKAKEEEFDVKEIKITLPFGGHLAGKWWGDKSVRPFVCLHGWQDNAGTFDRLIPLLPQKHSYLAIDLLGHGLSSRLPDGMQYHSIDNLYQIHDLCMEYGWEKVSLIGHSMGAILCFMFASIFPKNVDMVIGIEGLKPSVYDATYISKMLEDRIKNFMLADKRNREKTEPPSYTLEEMADKLEIGTHKSVTKEFAPYLLRRNVQKSEKHLGKYFFTRDSRLKFSMGANFNNSVSVELAKRMDMPYMVIKAKNAPYFEKKEYHEEVVNVLKESNKNFEYHLVDGTHHLHLTQPEIISGLVSEFIIKHKKQ